MNPVGQRKCIHCKQFFVPDVRQRTRQCHCAQPDCRRESKAASQRRWLGRPENRDYFRRKLSPIPSPPSPGTDVLLLVEIVPD
jgi:hypothetical protein